MAKAAKCFSVRFEGNFVTVSRNGKTLATALITCVDTRQVLTYTAHLSTLDGSKRYTIHVQDEPAIAGELLRFVNLSCKAAKGVCT